MGLDAWVRGRRRGVYVPRVLRDIAGLCGLCYGAGFTLTEHIRKVVMFTLHRTSAALSLAVTLGLGCTVNKGDDSSAGESSTGEAPATDGQSSGAPTTGNIDEPLTGGTGGTGETGVESTGETGDTGEETSDEACLETVTVIDANVSEPLGFTSTELLANKLGKRETTLKFSEDPTTMREELKGLALPLTVEVRHEGGEVRLVQSTVNPDYDDSGFEGAPFDCVDRMEIDVKFDFVTDGGEFDEHHDAVLVASQITQASLRVPLLPPGVMGTFDPANVYDPAADPPWVVTGLEVGAAWDGDLAGGTLLNEVHVGEGEDGIVGFGGIATWGAFVGF